MKTGVCQNNGLLIKAVSLVSMVCILREKCVLNMYLE